MLHSNAYSMLHSNSLCLIKNKNVIIFHYKKIMFFCKYFFILPIMVQTMVLILDGNSEHVAHSRRKICLFGEKDPICDCFEI